MLRKNPFRTLIKAHSDSIWIRAIITLMNKFTKLFKLQDLEKLFKASLKVFIIMWPKAEQASAWGRNS